MQGAKESRVAVVVGVGPGLGHSIALRFGREKYRVALVARGAEITKGTKQAVEAAGGEALQIQADMRNEAEIERAFAEIRARLGHPLVLVYNAVRAITGSLSELATTSIREELQVDAVSALACVQQVLPNMKSQKRGTILFTGGGTGINNNIPQYLAVGMGKAALRALAQGLSTELAEQGIHVAVVTVMGHIARGTPFDPDVIAEEYWKLHVELQPFTLAEIRFTGASAVERPTMFSQ